ncbi:carboxymuconolactone decarboxylase family protein [Phytomonospora sp. NPDC050363]|uniref:carboxymuconolactone decarboxylase family protein n=1 Tax=Phytomonospora sp. NPDC050363 TaxID=3155642 RepID=UPI0033F58BF7
MTRRLPTFAEHAAKGYRAMLDIGAYLGASELPHRILELVKLRVSQINGCGFCVDMHSHEAAAAGETATRLYAVAAWRDTPFFTEDERAALAFAEAATRIADGGHVGDEVWAEAERHFDEGQLAALVMSVSTINAWNRINVALANPAPTR